MKNSWKLLHFINFFANKKSLQYNYVFISYVHFRISYISFWNSFAVLETRRMFLFFQKLVCKKTWAHKDMQRGETEARGCNFSLQKLSKNTKICIFSPKYDDAFWYELRVKNIIWFEKIHSNTIFSLIKNVSTISKKYFNIGSCGFVFHQYWSTNLSFYQHLNCHDAGQPTTLSKWIIYTHIYMHTFSVTFCPLQTPQKFSWISSFAFICVCFCSSF